VYISIYFGVTMKIEYVKNGATVTIEPDEKQAEEVYAIIDRWVSERTFTHIS
jgi:virulence-associated protein VagC